MPTENKTKPTKASVTKFIDAIPDPVKRTDAKTFVKLMQKATGEKPHMYGASIIGFGIYHYVYDTGREGDAPVLAFSPRKAANVVYGALGFPGADGLLPSLGKHTRSKGCLYIKKLADVDQKVLEKLLAGGVAANRAKY